LDGFESPIPDTPKLNEFLKNTLRGFMPYLFDVLLEDAYFTSEQRGSNLEPVEISVYLCMLTSVISFYVLTNE
jgi:hypothetical protein